MAGVGGLPLHAAAQEPSDTPVSGARIGLIGSMTSIPSPSGNALHLGPLELRAYGLVIAIGVVIATAVAQRRWAARGGDPVVISSLATSWVVAGLIGARAYHVLTDHQRFEGRWWHAVAVWEGGLGITGGLLAGVLTGVALARRRSPAPAPDVLEPVA